MPTALRDTHVPTACGPGEPKSGPSGSPPSGGTGTFCCSGRGRWSRRSGLRSPSSRCHCWSWPITHSPAKTGLMAALRGLPFALFCLPAGALTDRWDRKRTMIACDTGRALALAAVPIACAFGHLTFALLVLVSLAEGTLFVFFNQAEAGALTRMVPKAQIPPPSPQNSTIELRRADGRPGAGRAAVRSVAGRAVRRGRRLLCGVRHRPAVRPRRVPGGAPGSRASALRREIGEGIAWLWRQPVLRFLACPDRRADAVRCGLSLDHDFARQAPAPVRLSGSA